MIQKFFLFNLLAIHNGLWQEKIHATTKLAVFVSPWVYILTKVGKWYNENYDYVAFVFVAIMFDHFLGCWVHAFIKKDFSIKKNIYGFLTKGTLVVIVGVLSEGIHTIIKSGDFITGYFSVLAKLMVFIYPAGSALMNCGVITSGKFPPIGFMNKIKNFNKNLDLQEFKQQDT